MVCSENRPLVWAPECFCSAGLSYVVLDNQSSKQGERETKVDGS